MDLARTSNVIPFVGKLGGRPHAIANPGRFVTRIDCPRCSWHAATEHGWRDDPWELLSGAYRRHEWDEHWDQPHRDPELDRECIEPPELIPRAVRRVRDHWIAKRPNGNGGRLMSCLFVELDCSHVQQMLNIADAIEERDEARERHAPWEVECRTCPRPRNEEAEEQQAPSAVDP